MKKVNFISVAFQALALVLVMAVLFPSVVKLNHAFSHHTHIVCHNDDSGETHFHQTDMDCEFYKFKLTTQFHFQNNLDLFIPSEDNYKISASQYEFVSKFQKLQTTLRGPPALI